MQRTLTQYIAGLSRKTPGASLAHGDCMVFRLELASSPPYRRYDSRPSSTSSVNYFAKVHFSSRPSNGFSTKATSRLMSSVSKANKHDDENGCDVLAAHDIPSSMCRLSKLVAIGTSVSRRNAETFIREGRVTIGGQAIKIPHFLIDLSEGNDMWRSIQVSGRHLSLKERDVEYWSSQETNKNDPSKVLQLNHRIRVWLVHKLAGELVSEYDPFGRLSLMERLRSGGVGKSKKGKASVHLIPIGRLDMQTEGLILVTSDGKYAREMELPSNKIHRTYRARVHGRITHSKLKAIRYGAEIDGIWYKGMQVHLEKVGKGTRHENATNSWFQITCKEGKNRQIRKVMEHLGCKYTFCSLLL